MVEFEVQPIFNVATSEDPTPVTPVTPSVATGEIHHVTVNTTPTEVAFSKEVESVMIFNRGDGVIYFDFDNSVSTNSFMIPKYMSIAFDLKVSSIWLIRGSTAATADVLGIG